MNPYAIIGVILLFVAGVFGGIQTGKKLERESHQKDIIKLQNQHLVEITAEVEKRNRQLAFEQAIARKASKDYEDALAKNKSDYNHDIAALRAAGGLRFASPCPRKTLAAGNESAGARRFDEARAIAEKLPERAEGDLQELARLPAEIENGLFELVERADDLAEQLRHLQQWVKDNGHYGDGHAGP